MKKIIIIWLIALMLVIPCCQKGDEEMATITIKDSEDARINSYYADDEYGETNGFSIGYDTSGPQTKRSLLKFDLSVLPSNIIITEAKLYMFQNNVYSSVNSITFDIYRVTGIWTEATVTWNNQPAVESTPTIVGLTCAHITESTWRNWIVTDLITEMIANSADSIMLRLQTESGALAEQFFSSIENGVTYQPYFYITYTLPLKIAPTEGSINKTVQNMMIAPDEGAIDKTVVGMMIAPDEGAIDKTVF